MFGRAVCTLGWIIIGAVIEGAAARCLHYEPTEVAVTGFVFERDDWGPPNYGEDPAHDSHERHDYVRLDRPLCVIGDSASNLNSATENNLKLLQLTWSQPKRPSSIGRHVLLRGKLFHGFSGHHHTRVLLWVDAAEPLPLAHR